MTTRLAIWLVGVTTAALGAASPLQAECWAIESAKIVLPGREPSPGAIVIDGETIVAVGANITVPAGCRRTDGSGRVVTAGLIDSLSTIGLNEISLESSTHDDDASGEQPIRAAYRAADGYNPRSVLIPIARLGGITAASLTAQGGLVSGQIGWVSLAGEHQAVAVRSRSIAMRVQVGASLASDLRRLDQLIADARLYLTHRSEWERNGSIRAFTPALDLAAVADALASRIPWVFAVDRASEIETLLRWAEENALPIVIQGGAEAHLVAPQLAARSVPVILDPLVYGPGSFDQIHARADNAARLRQAAVTVAISTFSGHSARKLRQLAGNAVRAGLPWADAFDAITQNPALIFAIKGAGVLRPGARADLAIWDGDPLELSTRLVGLTIAGQSIRLESRQTALFEKYRHLPGTPIPALALP
jgi:imidazolonepropionase-like amidohydrolase